MKYEEAEIDRAYEKLKEIFNAVANIDLLAENEADARLKLIDRILMDVLYWQPDQIHTEVIDENTRIDYLLRTISSCAIVEAKRPAKVFDFLNDSGQAFYSLRGPVLTSGEVGKAIQQVKEYARNQGVGLAAATNGIQWVIFLASRADGVAPDSGYGFIFRSKEELLDPAKFKIFFNLFSRKSVQNQTFLAQFSKVEGRLRSAAPPQASRLVSVRRGPDQQPKKSDIAKALDPLIRELFLTLTPEKEREIVRECFVETRESLAADDVLQRLISEITDNIEKIDTKGQVLTREVEERIQSSDSQTVAIVGQIGAGKSTYLDRFFEHILRSDLRKQVLLVRLQLENARPDSATFAQYLRQQTIESVRNSVFGTEAPTFEQLKGAFYSLYDQLKKGEHAPLYKRDQNAFDELFSVKLEQLKSDQEAHLRMLLSHGTKSLKKLICIVYDNVDHFENDIQTMTFQHAQWVNGLGRVLSIVPVRDSTYWQASTRGPFHAQPHVTLYLPRPSVGKVLVSRFKYAELQLDKLDRAEEEVSLYSLKGLRIKVEHPKELFQILHQLFSKEVYPNHILTGLSGGNIRAALRIFHETMTSPHMPIDKLLAAYLSQGTYKLRRRDKFHFERAVMLGHWKYFKQERSAHVLNALCTPRHLEASPLLALRICERLYDIRTLDNSQAERGFESVSNLLSYFAATGVPSTLVDEAIVILVQKALLEPYDRRALSSTKVDANSEDFRFVRLSTSGRLHRSWARYSRFYGLLMIEDMEVFDSSAFKTLENQLKELPAAVVAKDWAKVRTHERTLGRAALAYLTERDRECMSIPSGDESLFGSQQTLVSKLFLWAVSDTTPTAEFDDAHFDLEE